MWRLPGCDRKATCADYGVKPYTNDGKAIPSREVGKRKVGHTADELVSIRTGQSGILAVLKDDAELAL
jgi:hypothetical protein